MTDVSIEPNQIERDLAQTRARMDTRLNDLQERLSPGQVIDDLMTYFRGSEGGDFARNLMTSVRDNPLPAALTGIGLTWLMASSTHVNGTTTAAPAASPTPAKPASGSRSNELELRLLAVGAEVCRLPGESEADHRARIDDARGEVLGLKRQAEDTAESFADRIGDALANARQGATEKLHDLQDGAADTIGQMKDSAMQAMGKIGLGGDAAQRATAGLMATLTGNPVALGAMGLMLGAVLGALVPQSEAEEAALGGVAGQARKAAVDLAQQAANKGGEIAQKVVDAGMDSARDQGLTSDKPLGEIFEEAKSGDLVDHVKHVAQDVVKAGDQALRDGGEGGQAEAERSHETPRAETDSSPAFEGVGSRPT
jgi:hypothetical protein